MQIVINIDDEDYEDITLTGENTINLGVLLDLREAVRNGTPLPKGHGKLIAEPTEEDIAKTVGGQNDFAECIRDAVKAVFDNAQTIIDADKAESEENND